MTNNSVSARDKITAMTIVLLHLLVLLGHGKAHLQLHISGSTWQSVFIAGVIFIAPIAATVLLWTRLQKTGLVLLTLSMAGSLIFGVAYHFLVPGSDNLHELHHGLWESLFRTTATLLAVTEAGAVAWCVRTMTHQHCADQLPGT